MASIQQNTTDNRILINHYLLAPYWRTYPPFHLSSDIELTVSGTHRIWLHLWAQAGISQEWKSFREAASFPGRKKVLIFATDNKSFMTWPGCFASHQRFFRQSDNSPELRLWASVALEVIAKALASLSWWASSQACISRRTSDSLRWNLGVSYRSWYGDSAVQEGGVLKDNRIGHEILTLKFSFNYIKIR